MADRKVVSREYLELCGLFWSTFKTPDGQKALAVLEERFFSKTPFDPANDRVTSFFVGQQDVVRFIQGMIKDARQCREAAPGELTNYSEEDEI